MNLKAMGVLNVIADKNQPPGKYLYFGNTVVINEKEKEWLETRNRLPIKELLRSKVPFEEYPGVENV